MPYYECVLIARQDVPASQVEALTNQFSEVIGTGGGKVTKTEYWGLKTLAYRIKKNRKGHYGLVDMEAGADVLEAIDGRQRYADDVLRYVTIRVDELREEPSAILKKGDDRKRRERR